MSYEHRDASLAVIGISAAVVAFLVVASIGVSSWFYASTYGGRAAVLTAGRQTSFRHGAEQRVGIVVDLQQVTESADEHLGHYSWVDRKAGIATIPIDRAMQLLAKGVKPAPAPQVPAQVP